MIFSRSAQTAILCFTASFLPINSFVAQAAMVPAGAYSYALGATAGRVFPIAGAPMRPIASFSSDDYQAGM